MGEDEGGEGPERGPFTCCGTEKQDINTCMI